VICVPRDHVRVTTEGDLRPSDLTGPHEGVPSQINDPADRSSIGKLDNVSLSAVTDLTGPTSVSTDVFGEQDLLEEGMPPYFFNRTTGKSSKSSDIAMGPSDSTAPSFEPAPSAGPESSDTTDGDIEPSVLCTCTTELELDGSSTETSHFLEKFAFDLPGNWESVREELPEFYKWEIEFESTHRADDDQRGCWTCTPLEDEDPAHIPLSIAKAPVVLPVQYRWPPGGGVNPPPDPGPHSHIDYHQALSVDDIRDILITFEDSIGFYVLINGLLQIIVPSSFDTVWASSHLPHKFGGLKVCYIEQTLEQTTLSSKVKTTRTDSVQQSHSSGLLNIFRPSRPIQPVQLNSFIEARGSSMSRGKFVGRIGLKVADKSGEPRLLMSSHVITEAILNKSTFGRSSDPVTRLREDWNKQVELWAGNAKVSFSLPISPAELAPH
jgi:hypothetical protein